MYMIKKLLMQPKFLKMDTTATTNQELVRQILFTPELRINKFDNVIDYEKWGSNSSYIPIRKKNIMDGRCTLLCYDCCLPFWMGQDLFNGDSETVRHSLLAVSFVYIVYALFALGFNPLLVCNSCLPGQREVGWCPGCVYDDFMLNVYVSMVFVTSFPLLFFIITQNKMGIWRWLLLLAYCNLVACFYPIAVINQFVFRTIKWQLVVALLSIQMFVVVVILVYSLVLFIFTLRSLIIY